MPKTYECAAHEELQVTLHAQNVNYGVRRAGNKTGAVKWGKSFISVP